MSKRSGRGRPRPQPQRAAAPAHTSPPPLPAGRVGKGSSIMRTAPRTPTAIEQSMTRSGMDSTAAMGPGRPLNPLHGYSQPPRAMDYPTSVNISTRTRASWGLASYDTIRAIYKVYDVGRMCVNHKIDELRSMELMFLPAKGVRGDVADAIVAAEAVLAFPDRERPFDVWLAKWLENAFKFDSAPLYKRRNLDGHVIGLESLDGTTVLPYIDEHGRRPSAPDPAYYQLVHGQVWGWYTHQDIINCQFRPQEDTPFGTAPMESLLLTANTDIRFQWHFLQMFTEGSIPGGFVEVPPDISSPDQVAEWQDYWDATVMGDQAKLHQLLAVPAGTKVTNTKPESFDPTFPEYLMMRTCAAHGVIPQDLGLVKDVNRATGETQTDIQFRVNTLPWVNWVQGILSRYLQQDIGLPVQVKLNTGRDKEDRKADAESWKIYVECGAASPDEMRTELLGLPVDNERPTPRFFNNTRLGPIPLLAIEGVSGKTDPETHGPAADQPALDMPYVGPIGIIPQAGTTNAAEDLAATDAYQAQERAQMLAQQGVPPQTFPTATVAKGAAERELASFRAFRRSRLRAGDWRDFEFRQLADPVAAHRLNDAGRAAVFKARGSVVAAGLAVRAADTGRVLMLQRALDDTDPAAGMWEFPGGHREGDEAALEAAYREWSEETGLELPAGHISADWTSPDGIYRCFVYEIGAESELSIGDGRDGSTDPDGDYLEALAWWDPAQLPGNPAVRRELAADMAQVTSALNAAPADQGVAGGASPTARDVYEQLAEDYPPSAMDWIVDGSVVWTGPAQVPLADIDFSNAETWRASSEPKKVKKFAKRIRKGDRKPVILVKTPGNRRLIVIDGHHRSLAYRSIGEPVTAYVGTAGTEIGPWDEFHTAQFTGHGTATASDGTDVAKASLPATARQWPGWERDLETAAIYSSRIRAALTAAVDPERLASQWTAGRRIVKATAGEQATAAAAAYLAAQGILDAITSALTTVLGDAYAEGWVIGARSAGSLLLNGTLDWGGWTPGDPDAANRVLGADGLGAGLQQMLDDAGIRINSLGQGRFDELAQALALALENGDSSDTLARDLADILDNASWADGVATTEIARAVAAASFDTYRANGIGWADWLDSNDMRVCPSCDDNAANGPYPLDQFPAMPDHPRCRCAPAPAPDPDTGLFVSDAAVSDLDVEE